MEKIEIEQWVQKAKQEQKEEYRRATLRGLRQPSAPCRMVKDRQLSSMITMNWRHLLLLLLLAVRDLPEDSLFHQM